MDSCFYPWQYTEWRGWYPPYYVLHPFGMLWGPWQRNWADIVGHHLFRGKDSIKNIRIYVIVQKPHTQLVYDHVKHPILKFFEMIWKQVVLDFLTILKNFSSLCEKLWNLMLQPLLSLTSPSVPNIGDVV